MTASEGPGSGPPGQGSGPRFSFLFGAFCLGGAAVGSWVASIAASEVYGAYPSPWLRYVGAVGGGLLGILACALTFGLAAFAKESVRANPDVLRCAGCRKKVHVPEEFAGRDVTCPHCNRTFTAPRHDGPNGGAA